jgi:GTP cyclohydrolase I
MEDVQNQKDLREIHIDQVGVSKLRYPITVLDRACATQHTVADLKMSVDLPKEFKGTHLSRFIETLSEHKGELTLRTLPNLLKTLKGRLQAKRARIEATFPYFLERVAPTSGSRALMDYECRFVAESNGGPDDFLLSVEVPVTSLCPCSKAISDYGAHNQRGYITIEIRTCRDKQGNLELVWIEELIEIAERSASSPVYPLIKRADERTITMQAFDHPAFVEDMVRDAAVLLQADKRINWYRVHAENEESIHNHNAYAQVEWTRPRVELRPAHDAILGASDGRAV